MNGPQIGATAPVMANDGLSCLNDGDVARVQNHFGLRSHISDTQLEQISNHILVCESCAKKIEDLREVRAEGMRMVMAQESIHVSNAPDIPGLRIIEENDLFVHRSERDDVLFSEKVLH